MTSMVADGNLKPALDLIKSKVHAISQGETLDANVFTDVVPEHIQQPTQIQEVLILMLGTMDYMTEKQK